MPPKTINVSVLLNRFKHQTRLIRGQRVALDTDVAALYGITIGHLRSLVGRNKAGFPPDILFQISHEEYAAIHREHAALPKKERPSKFPYAFTEVALLMVSSVLRGPQAAQISVDIIRELFGFNRN